MDVEINKNGEDTTSQISTDDHASKKATVDNNSNKKNAKNNRPISCHPVGSNKKTKNLVYDYAMTDYRHKKEELALAHAEEVRRHNKAMENIAFTTADIEKKKY
jgi:hypothetical protein